jgi:hypothetical protein
MRRAETTRLLSGRYGGALKAALMMLLLIYQSRLGKEEELSMLMEESKVEKRGEISSSTPKVEESRLRLIRHRAKRKSREFGT